MRTHTPFVSRTVAAFATALLLMLPLGAKAQSGAAAVPSAPVVVDKAPCHPKIENPSLTQGTSLAQAILAPFSLSKLTCSGLLALLGVPAKVPGNKHLVGPNNFDAQTASRELTEAESNAEFRQALAAEQQGESSLVRLALIKAAVLYDFTFSHAAARELAAAISLADKRTAGGGSK